MTDTIIQYLTLAGTCIASIAAVIGACVGTVKKIKDAFNTKEKEAQETNKQLLQRLDDVVYQNAKLMSLLEQEKNARLNIVEVKKNEQKEFKKAKNLHRHN